jgi:NADP-dependent 3-hydroxy acid dehydrogenase YdfG
VCALTNQVAVVAGASGGIGAAIAHALAQRGVRLCLVGRDTEKLRVVADRARQLSSHVSIHETDLGIDGEVHRLVADLGTEYGGVDILIHAAGVISVGEIGQTSIEALDNQYRINVRAAYLLTQMLLPMLKDRRGQVVFINSSTGLVSKAGAGQYAATKHALKAFADSLRAEVNADGVRVISVYPGQTASPMQAALYEAAGKPYIPERLLRPADVAEVVLFALSMPGSAEITDIAVRPMMGPGVV